MSKSKDVNSVSNFRGKCYFDSDSSAKLIDHRSLTWHFAEAARPGGSGQATPQAELG